MFRIGFDNDKYLSMQSERINERIQQFGGKLYLEFGGKLFDDYHASRVLPGFEPDSKIRLLLQMKEQAEMVIVINANDIENNKIRGDLGITYDMDVLRLIDAFRSCGLYVGSVVLTRFANQAGAIAYQKHLESLGIKVFRHYPIPGYPSAVHSIVSDEGLGKNDYIETTKPLVVITAPGPGSGKMATCLSQLYHEHKRGIQAGYAKFETFPIWSIPLKHPVNLAYEAATVDLADVNMIDPFHLEAYGVTTVNYNRDVEIYPVLNEIFTRIYGSSRYKSPTDMGVNMAGFAICDDEATREASLQEIIRRYYQEKIKVVRGKATEETVGKLELLMSQAGIGTDMRKTVSAALLKERMTGGPAASIELPDGRIVTGKTSEFLGALSAALLNALKALAGIPDDVRLISPEIIAPVENMKVNCLGSKNPRLHLDELLVALSVCAVNDENAKAAMAQLRNLKHSEAHSTVIPSQEDEDVFRKLGINLTMEPVYQTKKLYHK